MCFYFQLTYDLIVGRPQQKLNPKEGLQLQLTKVQLSRLLCLHMADKLLNK